MPRPVLLLPVLLLVLTACGGADPAPPEPAGTAAGACSLLTDDQVGQAVGGPVQGAPDGADGCTWSAGQGPGTRLDVIAATREQFEEERDVNSADSEVEPPDLGLGDASYVLVGEPGGTGSAAVLVGQRMAVLLVDGGLPPDRQQSVLTGLLGLVAPQL